MAYETRDNSGSMFKNTRKEKDTHADMTGEIMVDGKLFWINGWRKVDKNGNPWYSMSVRPKTAKSENDRSVSNGRPSTIDDEIPFD